jgi:hypothetical protein
LRMTACSTGAGHAPARALHGAWSRAARSGCHSTSPRARDARRELQPCDVGTLERLYSLLGGCLASHVRAAKKCLPGAARGRNSLVFSRSSLPSGPQADEGPNLRLGRSSSTRLVGLRRKPRSVSSPKVLSTPRAPRRPRRREEGAWRGYVTDEHVASLPRTDARREAPQRQRRGRGCSALECNKTSVTRHSSPAAGPLRSPAGARGAAWLRPRCRRR